MTAILKNITKTYEYVIYFFFQLVLIFLVTLLDVSSVILTRFS